MRFARSLGRGSWRAAHPGPRSSRARFDTLRSPPGAPARLSESISEKRLSCAASRLHRWVSRRDLGAAASRSAGARGPFGGALPVASDSHRAPWPRVAPPRDPARPPPALQRAPPRSRPRAPRSRRVLEACDLLLDDSRAGLCFLSARGVLGGLGLPALETGAQLLHPSVDLEQLTGRRPQRVPASSRRRAAAGRSEPAPEIQRGRPRR